MIPIDADRPPHENRAMKIRSRIVAWALLVVIGTASHSFGRDVTTSYESVAADVVIARPLWFVATALGVGLFLVTLPAAALSKGVNKSANTLVVKPAQATFTRPLGDFSSLD
jgi:hypothetical protein